MVAIAAAPPSSSSVSVGDAPPGLPPAVVVQAAAAWPPPPAGCCGSRGMNPSTLRGPCSKSVDRGCPQSSEKLTDDPCDESEPPEPAAAAPPRRSTRTFPKARPLLEEEAACGGGALRIDGPLSIRRRALAFSTCRACATAAGSASSSSSSALEDEELRNTRALDAVVVAWVAARRGVRTPPLTPLARRQTQGRAAGACTGTSSQRILYKAYHI